MPSAQYYGSGSDYLLKIDKIEGESQQDGHKGWIELQSWSWGQVNQGSMNLGGGGGSGKVQMEDFQFTCNFGTHSPTAFVYCATGEHIERAELHLRKAGGKQEVYLIWRFEDVFLSSYRSSGQDSDANDQATGSARSRGSSVLPVDKISFNYTKIELEYKPQTKGGTLGAAMKANFDVKTGKGAKG